MTIAACDLIALFVSVPVMLLVLADEEDDNLRLPDEDVLTEGFFFGVDVFLLGFGLMSILMSNFRRTASIAASVGSSSRPRLRRCLALLRSLSSFRPIFTLCKSAFL